MLRVGLTGGLGAGKSTVARMLAEHGAAVLSSDEIGRELMQPGTAVYAEIVARFGPSVVLPDGSLDRTALARVAFAEGGAEALNGIVHPAVIAEQQRRMTALPDDAIAVVESALIFETRHGGPNGWRMRFDRLVLVTAPEAIKVARFIDRAGGIKADHTSLEAEARRRLAMQMPDEAKWPLCDFVLVNDGGLKKLEMQVEQVWRALIAARQRNHSAQALSGQPNGRT